MVKKWTEAELNRIYEVHPELRLSKVLSVDEIVIEFLKIHEVDARPPKNRSRIDGAISGAITGFAGADVGGDSFLIQGQNKQTKLQEWTSWKQWALNHKDFEEFKKKANTKANEKNKEIEKKLYEPNFVEKWKNLFNKEKKIWEKQQKRERDTMKYTFVGLFSFILLATFFGISESERIKEEEEAKSRAQALKNEKIRFCNSVKTRFDNFKFFRRKPVDNFVEGCIPLAIETKTDCYFESRSDPYENVFSQNAKWDKCVRRKLDALLQ